MTEIQLKAKRERDAAAKRVKRAEAKAAKAALVEAVVKKAQGPALIEDMAAEARMAAASERAKKSAIVPQTVAPIAAVPDAFVDNGSQIDAADHLMELSATAAKKRAERRPADPRVTVAPPEADAALVVAGFTFARTEQNASGYVHEDGRTVLAESSGQWTLLVNGLESGGANLTTLLTELAKPVPKRATKKALRINKAHTRGAHAAAAIKAGKTALAVSLTPARALEVIHEAEAIAAAKRAAKVATAVPGMPPNVVRAVEMLGSLTDGKFNLHDLRGDKHYGHRLALLKRLFDREHVVMAETGINNLMQAFYSALGANVGASYAAQAADFTVRCQDLLTKVHDVKLTASKAAKRTVRAVRNAVKPSLIVPGIVIPQPKPPSKAAKKAAAEKEAAALQMELAVTRLTAQPHSNMKSLGRLEANALRLLIHANGLVSLKLERWNSQGAMHIWKGDDGRVVSGVLTPALAADVKVQAPNLDGVKELAGAWLDDKKVKKTAEMEYVLHCVMHAVNRAQSAFALSVLPYQLPAPRPSAAEPTITPASVRLLEDSVLGAVLVQLERANSQGALVCYNNGMQVGVGVCPPEILETLRQMPTEVNLVTAVKQLLNPAVPSVPVTPTAAKHLTAVMHCKENIMKNTAEAPAVEKKSKKFAAKTAPVSAALPKPATKAAKAVKPTAKAEKTERAPRAGSLAGKKIKVISKDMSALREGTKRYIGLGIILKSKTTDEAIPKLIEAGCNSTWFAFATAGGYVELV